MDQTITFGVSRDVCGMLFRGLDAIHIRYKTGMGPILLQKRYPRHNIHTQGFVTSTITTVFTVSPWIVPVAFETHPYPNHR